MAGDTVNLALNGAWLLNEGRRSALIKWIKQGFAPIVTKAGKTLSITMPGKLKRPAAAPRSLTLKLNFEKDEKVPARRCGFVLGTCGTGNIYITAHQYMGVCGDKPKIRNTRVLTTDEVLGHALANTGIHELGHYVGGFDDNRISGNFMSTLGAPRSSRTVQSMRAYFAGTMSWTPDQEKELVARIKSGNMAFDEEFTVKSVPTGSH